MPTCDTQDFRVIYGKHDLKTLNLPVIDCQKYVPTDSMHLDV